MNTIENDKIINWWVDIAGCLQPCPVCHRAEYRDRCFEIAHDSCWNSLTRQEQVKLATMYADIRKQQGCPQ